MQDLISMLWRRLPLVLTVMILGTLISFYFIVSSPRVYESSAVIQVDTPAVTEAGSDSALPASRRVQLIEQRLMARGNIREVITELGLFTDTPGLSETDKIAAVRKSTRIDSIQAPGVATESGMSLAAIVITSQAETPDTAAALANYFTNSVVNRDRENREARIAEARQYLTDEEDRLSDQLSRQDRQIAEFSSANEDALPSSQEYLQTELAQLNASEAALDREIMGLQRGRLALEAGSTAADARPSATLVQQIRTAEIELAQARRTLAPDHPEIKRLEDQLKRLNSGGESVSDVVERQGELYDSQLEQFRQQKAQMQDRRKEIERARAKAPQVSRDLDNMVRQQRRLQDRYAEISRQLAQVETQQKLMDNDQTERFVILERALAPEYPAASNRKKRAALGLFASIGLSFGLAFILEMLHPVLRRTEQFARATGTRPVISLPYRPNARDIRLKRLSLTYVVVLLIAGAIAMLWLIGGLPGVASPGVVPAPTAGLG
ncbi:lipopolysaccharide biosynthesis protein [Paracoccus limosus]|uniref:Lipopolysaccharide biosynthesis protein n=1 Tax=Paracoccus limosus TaxID=913252 RepID=A0A844H020_9RHOB|nr:Wzz/FepE/Etk N-terminal domain-containing protein [Paracoccus limosus]MTH34219.1 lipopolysaccharide biosynthesis protein [Paracoccus limosus]